MLQIKHGEGSAGAKFLDHRRNHHGTEADRVSGNHKESELEGQAHADEAVIKAGWVIGGGSFCPIRANMKYSGVRTNTPQMPAIQNMILANFMERSAIHRPR